MRIVRVALGERLGRVARVFPRLTCVRQIEVLGHELRNPLTPISLALELIRNRDGHATPNEIAIIQRQLDHM
ncbi:hybrid sensor histidine kinase/response regulator, partial [Burkholderia territorii]